ncbi:MAG: preprotein translocase subunit SecG [Rickettsiales bacterium]|jgi:preprotein translocase subunit SecG|nr:preprotein translocase subunit SecG [Rickettsiales bacterium]
MLTFLLTLETIIAIALIAIILMQKSEGGVLGIGGGAKFGGALSGENAKNLLTVMTKWLSIAFFGLCMILSLVVYNQNRAKTQQIYNQVQQEQPVEQEVPTKE